MKRPGYGTKVEVIGLTAQHNRLSAGFRDHQQALIPLQELETDTFACDCGRLRESRTVGYFVVGRR